MFKHPFVYRRSRQGRKHGTLQLAGSGQRHTPQAAQLSAYGALWNRRPIRAHHRDPWQADATSPQERWPDCRGTFKTVLAKRKDDGGKWWQTAWRRDQYLWDTPNGDTAELDAAQETAKAKAAVH